MFYDRRREIHNVKKTSCHVSMVYPQVTDKIQSPDMEELSGHRKPNMGGTQSFTKAKMAEQMGMGI